MTKDLPIYKITIDDEYSDGETLGIEMIAFTNLPAIKVKGMSFGSEKRLMFSDGLKHRITAPAMIPMDIYRKNDGDGEYYVQFTEEVIEQIHTKFMADLRNRDIFNLEHDTEKKVPAYILETWIVDNPKQDKAYSTFGIEVPKGTLMVTAQVTDADYYAELVANDQVGFSIEGFLGLKLSEQIKLNKMMLPDGEHRIEDKIYVVKDGEVVEIKEVEKEPTEEVVEEEMSTEEVAMEETTVEDEVTTEATTTEEEMAIDPATDAEAIAAIVLPILEEREKALIAMIADLRNQIEEMYAEKEEEVVETQMAQLSMSEKFAKFKQFVNQ
ncbi:Phage-like element PBSX protein, XkdF [uncultured Caudovirales phage]|uniref:Phage-like element PBSX protein, XkdF n=1 Tax=uncultured Caudovirales phage TaxID=2100421 RepID=A0A6J7X4Y7_9CAUD|nr:Phage-like element PBSX protein, XkdF [uncultured Caudovirales phage]